MKRPTTATGLATALLLTLGAVAGCSSDSPSEGDDAAEETTTTEAEEGSSPTSTSDSSDDALVVTAVDFAFEGVPESVPAGTAIELINESDAELHEIVALPLPEGETRSAEELVALGDAMMGVAAGPPQVVVALPGEPSFAAEGDGVLTQPGRYLFLCTIPVGADPAAYLEAAEKAGGPPEGFTGPPHLAEGMFSEISVTG